MEITPLSLPKLVRFVEILPHWQNFMSLATFLGFSWHLQNVEPSMAKFYAIGQISIIVKRTKIEKQSNHLVTLLARPFQVAFQLLHLQYIEQGGFVNAES